MTLKNYTELKKYLFKLNKGNKTVILSIPAIGTLESLGIFLFSCFQHQTVGIVSGFFVSLVFFITSFTINKKQNFLPARSKQSNRILSFLEGKDYFLIHSYDLIYSTYLARIIVALDSHHYRTAYVNNCLFEIEQIKEKIAYNKQVLQQIKSPDGRSDFEANLKLLPHLIAEKFKDNHNEITLCFKKTLDYLIQSGQYLDNSSFNHFMTFTDTQNVECIKAIIEEIDQEELHKTQQMAEYEKKLNIQTNFKSNIIEHKKTLSL